MEHAFKQVLKIKHKEDRVFDEHILISKMKNRYKGKTYKEISLATGINPTRVFRIFNGSKISYQEALKMYQLVGGQKTGLNNFVSIHNSKKIKNKINRLARLERIVGLEKMQ